MAQQRKDLLATAFGSQKSLFNNGELECGLSWGINNINYSDFTKYINECITRDVDEESFYKCCRKNDIEFAKLFFSRIKKSNKYSIILNGLIESCCYDSIDVFNWIDTSIHLVIQCLSSKLFGICCKNDSIKLANLLKEKFISFEKNNEAFVLACSNGSIQVAQWLNSIAEYSLDIFKECFIKANASGHTNVCEWIVSIKGDSIIENSSILFSNVCFNADINHIKWTLELVENKSDFDILPGFRSAILFARSDILIWMMEMNNSSIESAKKDIFMEYFSDERRENCVIKNIMEILKLN
jgi:hypothetical protein